MTIAEIIQHIATQGLGEIYSKVCKVTAVDKSARTVDVEPLDESADIKAVRLQPDISKSTGLVQIPRNGSMVVVTFINEATAFVSLVTDPEEIIIDTDQVTINGGGNDGLINIRDLVTKLNNLENMLNAHIVVFNAHTHPYFPGPLAQAPTSVTATPDTQTPLVPTVKLDLEDGKVKH